MNSFTQTMQNIVQQPMMFAPVYPQPMMPQPMQPMMQPQMVQPHRQPNQPNYSQRSMNDQSSGFLMPQTAVNPMSIFGPPMPMQQPMNQMPYNANPMSNMGMGGIFNQLGQMGMGGQSGFSPMMNPYGNMGGFRMW